MATRIGLATATFEATPDLLAVVNRVLEECLENGQIERALHEYRSSLDWAIAELSEDSPDSRDDLIRIASIAVAALAQLHRRETSE
jgi:hypothetical protein